MDRVYRGNCNNVLERDFERRVQGRANRLIHSEWTWKDRVFNKCLRNAVKKRLREVGNECLPDPDAADDCAKLGEAAAYIIVQDSGLCRTKSMKKTRSIEKFQRACRDEAFDVCETSIRDELKNCGADSSLQTARPLKRTCWGEILDLTGGRMLR